MVKITANKINYKINLHSLELANQHLFAERLKNEILVVYPSVEIIIVSKKKLNRHPLLELECFFPDASQAQYIKHHIDEIALDVEERLVEQINTAKSSAA